MRAIPIFRPAVPAYHRQTVGGSPLRALDRASIPRPMGLPCPPTSVGSSHLPVESGHRDASQLYQMPRTTNFPKCCARKIRTARQSLKREAVPSYGGLALAEATAQNRAHRRLNKLCPFPAIIKFIFSIDLSSGSQTCAHMVTSWLRLACYGGPSGGV